MPLDLKLPQDTADPKKKGKFICKAFRSNDDRDIAFLLIKWAPFVDNEQNISLLCNGVLIRHLLQPYLPNERVNVHLVKFCSFSLSILENKNKTACHIEYKYNAVHYWSTYAWEKHFIRAYQSLHPE